MWAFLYFIDMYLSWFPQCMHLLSVYRALTLQLCRYFVIEARCRNLNVWRDDLSKTNKVTNMQSERTQGWKPQVDQPGRNKMQALKKYCLRISGRFYLKKGPPQAWAQVVGLIGGLNCLLTVRAWIDLKFCHRPVPLPKGQGTVFLIIMLWLIKDLKCCWGPELHPSANGCLYSLTREDNHDKPFSSYGGIECYLCLWQIMAFVWKNYFLKSYIDKEFVWCKIRVVWIWKEVMNWVVRVAS